MYKFFFFLFFTITLNAQQVAVLKYNGGGDWYSNPTALKNLIQYCNTNISTKITSKPETVETNSIEIFNYPFVHMTGHGNVVFSNGDADNLRNYMLAGGFLHIDDNYGMDPYVRVAMKKVFPELEFVEIPFDHPIYNQKFKFPNGLPKIHQHDQKPSKGFGLFWEGRLICYYSYESDLGDGWEDPDVHNDPDRLRQQALKMGANLVQYAFEY